MQTHLTVCREIVQCASSCNSLILQSVVEFDFLKGTFFLESESSYEISLIYRRVHSCPVNNF